MTVRALGTLVGLALLAAGIPRALCAQSGPAGAAARMFGVVVDSTGAPIAHATISIVGTALVAESDSGGTFRLASVPPGTHTVAYRAMGYRQASVDIAFPADHPVLWTQVLAAVPAALAPVVVRERSSPLALGLAGFERRRKLGRGQFATAEEWAGYAPRDVEAVLRRFNSLKVVLTPDGPLVVSTRGLTVHNMQPAACGMRIGVDGELMPSTFSIQDVHIDQIEAIEVYSGPATMPAEFNSGFPGHQPQPVTKGGITPSTGSFAPETNTYCGLVMLWMK